MNVQERLAAIAKMKVASSHFYFAAVQIGNHPFIEFCGLMNEYIKACEEAHAKGIDFSECNIHSGQELPMQGYMIKYVNEKLECIFTGRSVMDSRTRDANPRIPPAGRPEQRDDSTGRIKSMKRTNGHSTFKGST